MWINNVDVSNRTVLARFTNEAALNSNNRAGNGSFAKGNNNERNTQKVREAFTNNGF